LGFGDLLFYKNFMDLGFVNEWLLRGLFFYFITFLFFDFIFDTIAMSFRWITRLNKFPKRR
jgi:hypothetical protein